MAENAAGAAGRSSTLTRFPSGEPLRTVATRVCRTCDALANREYRQRHSERLNAARRRDRIPARGSCPWRSEASGPRLNLDGVRVCELVPVREDLDLVRPGRERRQQRDPPVPHRLTRRPRRQAEDVVG